MQLVHQIMPLIGVGATGLLALLSIVVMLQMALEGSE